MVPRICAHDLPNVRVGEVERDVARRPTAVPGVRRNTLAAGARLTWAGGAALGVPDRAVHPRRRGPGGEGRLRQGWQTGALCGSHATKAAKGSKASSR